MCSARVLVVLLVLATSSTALAASTAIKFGKLVDGTGRVFTNAVVIVEAAGRSVHLHPIRSRRDDLPHCVDDRIHSVGHDADGRGWRSTASDPDSET